MGWSFLGGFWFGLVFWGEGSFCGVFLFLLVWGIFWFWGIDFFFSLDCFQGNWKAFVVCLLKLCLLIAIVSFSHPRLGMAVRQHKIVRIDHLEHERKLL